MTNHPCPDRETFCALGLLWKEKEIYHYGIFGHCFYVLNRKRFHNSNPDKHL